MNLAVVVISVALICGDPGAAPDEGNSHADNPAKTTASFEPTTGGLGTRITVTLTNPPNRDPAKKRLLYLDGVPVNAAESPYLRLAGDKKGTLTFRLERTKETKDAWLTLVKGREWERDVTVQLGTENGIDQSITSEKKFTLIVKPASTLGFAGLGLLAMLAVFVYLANTTNLLRVSGSKTVMRPTTPFSLGLTQMAFWFFLSFAAFIYIGIVTWNFSDSISSTVLALMGISAGTALGSLAIDSDKNRSRESLLGEEVALKADVAALDGSIATATDDAKLSIMQKKTEKERRLKEIDDSLKSIGRKEAKTMGFAMDMLQDDAGISLHRFQIVCWTLVLGCVFVREVISNLAMPDFNETLLGLMGISSGTYLGFKFPVTRREGSS